MYYLCEFSVKGSPEVRRHEVAPPPPVPPNKPTKPEATNVYQHPIPIVVPTSKPTPPLKPPKRNVEGDWEVFSDDETSQQSGNDAPLKIKEFPKLQEESSRRRSDDTVLNKPKLSEEDGLAPGRGLVLDLKQAKLKPVPKAPPRGAKPKTPSGEDGNKLPTNLTPKAPPRIKKNSAATPVTPIDTIGIDDIGKKMNNIIAGLNDRLNDIDDNYVDDTEIPEIPEIREPPPLEKPSTLPPTSTKPVPPAKRPILPPRPPDNNKKISTEKNTTDSQVKKTDNAVNSERKSFSPLPLKRIVWKKLRAEGVQIHETPYTMTVSLCVFFYFSYCGN